MYVVRLYCVKIREWVVREITRQIKEENGLHGQLISAQIHD